MQAQKHASSISLQGYLRYTGYDDVWHICSREIDHYSFVTRKPIFRDSIRVDFKVWILDAIQKLNGAHIEYDVGIEHLIVRRTENTSEPTLIAKDKAGKNVRADFHDGSFGIITTYLASIMERLNGRAIVVLTSPDYFILKPENEDEEDVEQISLYENNSFGVIDNGKEKTVCGSDTMDQCIFFSHKSGVPVCTKLAPEGLARLKKLAEGKSDATRIGDCKLLGRVRKPS